MNTKIIWLVGVGVTIAAAIGLAKFRTMGDSETTGAESIQGADPNIAAGQFDPQKPQCGHHCLFRAMQVCGVPTSVQQLKKILPPRENGHSFLDLIKVLKSTGIDATGLKLEFDQLTSDHLYIAHLVSPNHFILLTSVDSHQVHLYDGNGKISVSETAEFLKRWSGNVIQIKKQRANLVPPNRKGAELRFEYLVKDIEGIPLSSKPTVFEFPFVNTGDKTLTIEEVAATCSCTSVEYPKTVEPGKSGVIKLTYSIKGDSEAVRKSSLKQNGPGLFSHQAHVQSNDPNFPLIDLEISGTCDASVRVVPNVLDVGSLSVGVPATRYVAIHYTGREPGFEVLSTSMDIPGVRFESKLIKLDTHSSKIFMAGAHSVGKVDMANKYFLMMVFTAEKPIWQIGGNLKVKSNVPGFEQLDIPIIGNAVSQIVASPSVLVGRPSETGPSDYTIQLESRTGAAFKVVSAHLNDSPIDFSVSVSEPAAKVDLQLTLPPLKQLESQLKLRLLIYDQELEVEIPVIQKPQVLSN